ncbi:MAG: hypothetical protein IPM40_13675 [Gammaproteobacteria bacterium]|nr:hypothetical protein [Gammaproteobacteria bacterium]
MPIDYAKLLCVCATVSATLTLLLLAKSIVSFTQTGPEIRDEIRRHYAYYTVFAMARLSAFACMVLLWMALLGTIPAVALAILAHQPPQRSCSSRRRWAASARSRCCSSASTCC